MNAIALDALTRRASLLSLGVAGLTAALTSPLSAGAKNKAKKKLKKKQQQKCQAQVGQCNDTYTAYCESISDDPDVVQTCLDAYTPCCESLASCDYAAFFACTRREM
jgi:hypothetical protein